MLEVEDRSESVKLTDVLPVQVSNSAKQHYLTCNNDYFSCIMSGSMHDALCVVLIFWQVCQCFFGLTIFFGRYDNLFATSLIHYTPFYSVLVSVSVFMTLSSIFYSIHSSNNSLHPHSVLPILFLPYWSFQLYIFL